MPLRISYCSNLIYFAPFPIADYWSNFRSRQGGGCLYFTHLFVRGWIREVRVTKSGAAL